jgi:hypothetical protein
MSLRLDFLPESENGRPLIPIHGDDRDAVTQLAKALGRLSRGALERLAIHDLPYVDAAECRLIAVRGERDQGAHELGSTKAFEWVESPARWADVAGLVVTLRPPSKSGHQYLAPSPFGGGRGIVVQLSVGEHWAL